MVSKIIWSPRSQQDLLTIWGYYSRVASDEVADTLIYEITSAGMRLQENPLLWKVRSEIALNIRSVSSHPYTIFYRVEKESVNIIRVIHERREANKALKNNE